MRYLMPYCLASAILLAGVQAGTTFKLNKHNTGTTSGILRKIESLGGGLRRRDDFDLDGASSGGLGYTVDVTLNGGPPIPVLIDTGSNQFWVASTTCDSCVAGGMTPSDIVLEDGCSEYALIYGIGSVNGCIESTTMEVGDYKVNDLHVLALKYVDDDMAWQGAFMSGLWGMARDGATADGSPTAVSLMYSQGFIHAPTVGFYLGREGDEADSEMTIGDVSALSYTQTDKKVALKSQDNAYDLFAVNLDSINVNGKTLGANTLAYIDTGSTAISTPEPLVGEIYNALFNGVAYKYKTSYIVPCDPLSNTTISFVLGGMSFNMAAEDLIGNPIATNYGWCYGRFVPLYSGVDTMVIGDAFLHNVYHTVNVQTGDVTFYELS
ncbi:hypothetical protein IAT38_006743 [Cryptococcus sp. DSM 104549]